MDTASALAMMGFQALSFPAYPVRAMFGRAHPAIVTNAPPHVVELLMPHAQSEPEVGWPGSRVYWR